MECREEKEKSVDESPKPQHLLHLANKKEVSRIFFLLGFAFSCTIQGF
jgi:hypothetical protein